MISRCPSRYDIGCCCSLAAVAALTCYFTLLLFPDVFTGNPIIAVRSFFALAIAAATATWDFPP